MGEIVVFSSSQELHLGIQGLMDSDGNLSMTEQGETIGIVIDRDQMQDFQDKHLFLGALDVGVIRVTR